jgi:hypothetical protein
MSLPFRLLALSLALVCGPLMAKPQKQDLKPNIVISDGKSGRKWGQFNEKIQERRVQKVGLVITRVSGGDDTFVNMRFGKDGVTFDGSKREYLKDAKRHEVWWNVNEAPKGRPLVINAYNGEVKLEIVSIAFAE